MEPMRGPKRLVIVVRDAVSHGPWPDEPFGVGVMAVSRNARRMAAKKRANMAACEAVNNAAILARRDIVKANLGRTPRRENSAGLVSSLYGGNAKPAGYTRALKWSHGVAK